MNDDTVILFWINTPLKFFKVFHKANLNLSWESLFLTNFLSLHPDQGTRCIYSASSAKAMTSYCMIFLSLNVAWSRWQTVKPWCQVPDDGVNDTKSKQTALISGSIYCRASESREKWQNWTHLSRKKPGRWAVLFRVCARLRMCAWRGVPCSFFRTVGTLTPVQPICLANLKWIAAQRELLMS